MLRGRVRTLLPVAALAAAALTTGATAGSGSTAPAGGWHYSEYRLSAGALDTLRTDFVDQVLSTHRPGTWAPLKMTLDDRDLRAMGLPSKRFLLTHRFPEPTLVTTRSKGGGSGGGGGGGGGTTTSSNPTVTTFAGTGFFGIRPGAWLLTVTDKEIGWCSMAHVYGSPGAYQVSTAGHCGNTGDIATVIAAAGNRAGATGVVLLDFGKYARSTGDGGVGNDWALIDVFPQYQNLVTPTMAFWGGPRGIYTKTGDVLTVSTITNSGRLSPSASLTPDPTLAQQVVHYGHGAGIGTGGTPRSGAAVSWRPTYFMFFGAITPGDSGSGSNVVTGDLATTMEAAGINTHIYVDPLMRSGLGIMAGTRATQVPAAIANGQLVPYPAPAPGLP